VVVGVLNECGRARAVRKPFPRANDIAQVYLSENPIIISKDIVEHTEKRPFRSAKQILNPFIWCGPMALKKTRDRAKNRYDHQRDNDERYQLSQVLVHAAQILSRFSNATTRPIASGSSGIVAD